jgi:integrase
MVKSRQAVLRFGGEPEGVAEAPPKDPEMLVAWDASRRPGLQALLEELQKETTTPQWTENDLQQWLLDDQEKAPSTVADRLRHIRFMETYPGQPVMLHGSRYQFLMTGRLFYAVRKQGNPAKGVEPAGDGALQKDLKCLKTLGRFLGVPPNVWPVSPPRIRSTGERMPTPEEVRALLHTDWTPNAKHSIENAWIKTVLAMHFGIGMRSPKEYWFLPADAYEPSAGLLTITEPKKRHRQRTVFVEPTWLAKGTNRPSLDNWLKWRARLNPEGRTMFPNPITGKDFPSPEAFKQFLDRRVKARFPWWHGYIARHWSCYARIIEGGFTDSSYNAVAEWFGHDSVDMTRDTYGPAARAYSKSPRYGTDWLSRAFAKPRANRQVAQNP